MKRYCVLLAVLLSINLNSFSQKNKFSFEENYDKAEAYIVAGQYFDALPILLKADSIKPNNSNINYKIGVCYMQSPYSKVKAIPFLEKAVINLSAKYQRDFYKETNAPYDALYYLAKAYHLAERFDEAISAFENYKTYIDANDKEKQKEINRRILICNDAKDLLNKPVNVKFYNLGDAINTQYSEYSPVISADGSTLIFTARRPESTGSKMVNGQYFEDIYISYKKDGKWTKAVPIDANVNSVNHDASLSLSADGRKLLIYKSEEKGRGNIYETNYVGDKWSTPIALADNINSSSKESYACISPDGDYLYFSSDRAGGSGGRDIYKAQRLPNGKLGDPLNLGTTINTPYNENIIFIQSDGNTIYFSSDGQTTMGGYDIFKSTFDNGQWSDPENLGYPVNTVDDDLFFVPTTDGVHAFMATSHIGTGLGQSDIYYVEFPDKKVIPLRVVSGFMKSSKDTTSIPSNIEIKITDDKNNLVGKYKPNPKNGKFLFILENGKNYNVEYLAEGYLYSSEKFSIPNDSSYAEIKRNVKLMPVNVGEKLIYNDISLDMTTNTFSGAKLSELVEFLNNNKNILVELNAYTMDDIDSKNSYSTFANALYKYLTDKQVDSEQIQLNKTAKAYGKKTVAGIKVELTILSTMFKLN